MPQVLTFPRAGSGGNTTSAPWKTYNTDWSTIGTFNFNDNGTTGYAAVDPDSTPQRVAIVNAAGNISVYYATTGTQIGTTWTITSVLGLCWWLDSFYYAQSTAGGSRMRLREANQAVNNGNNKQVDLIEISGESAAGTLRGVTAGLSGVWLIDSTAGVIRFYGVTAVPAGTSTYQRTSGDADNDLVLDTANSNPRDLAIDATNRVMLVTDSTAQKVFAYNIP